MKMTAYRSILRFHPWVSSFALALGRALFPQRGVKQENPRLRIVRGDGAQA